METQVPSEPPARASIRFELELEFVGALANPQYLQYLNFHFPALFQSTVDTQGSNKVRKGAKKIHAEDDNSDAAKFARYLKYLLYWSRPEYAQYLTHPAGTIRNLELLQNEQFRKDIFREEMNVRLEEGFTGRADRPQDEAAAINADGVDAEAGVGAANDGSATAIAT